MNPGSLSTSMIKTFVTIVNIFQYKTIITKISFIDLTRVLGPVRCEFLNMCSALLLIDYLKNTFHNLTPDGNISNDRLMFLCEEEHIDEP